MSAFEAVVLVGLPASGKTWYYHCYLPGYVNISLDDLKTRERETRQIEACIAQRTSFVIDNTNVTVEERSGYIKCARKHGIPIRAVYIKSSIEECLRANAFREKNVPNVAIFTKAKALQVPTVDEGFDEVEIVEN